MVRVVGKEGALGGTREGRIGATTWMAGKIKGYQLRVSVYYSGIFRF